MSPLSLGEWARIETSGFRPPRPGLFYNMVMGEGFTAQKKMLAVGPIFALYSPMVMFASAGSLVRTQWDLLKKGSGFVGSGFPELH